jgi:hypothetical protein
VNVTWDSSEPLTSRQRREAYAVAHATLDTAARQLRQRFDANWAAGRLIDDDGDEHGCPTRGTRAGCRLVQEAFTLDADE